MRRKVENKIRRALELLGESGPYRIDRVRAKTGVIKKVFDKTILDMARLGTIELMGGDTRSMSASEIEGLVVSGDTVYVYFKLLDEETQPQPPASLSEMPADPHAQRPTSDSPDEKPPEIILFEINPETWRKFESRCKTDEEKNPLQKIQEMIEDYNRKEGV